MSLRPSSNSAHNGFCTGRRLCRFRALPLFRPTAVTSLRATRQVPPMPSFAVVVSRARGISSSASINCAAAFATRIIAPRSISSRRCPRRSSDTASSHCDLALSGDGLSRNPRRCAAKAHQAAQGCHPQVTVSRLRQASDVVIRQPLVRPPNARQPGLRGPRLARAVLPPRQLPDRSCSADVPIGFA